MKTSVKETLVGAVTLSAAAILIISIIFGKDIDFDSEYMQIRAEFENVDGLKEGAKIYYRGINSGSVTQIDLEDGKVIVSSEIRADLGLTGRPVMYIVSRDIMGSKVIRLENGNGSEAFDSSVLIEGRKEKSKHETFIREHSPDRVRNLRPSRHQTDGIGLLFPTETEGRGDNAGWLPG